MQKLQKMKLKTGFWAFLCHLHYTGIHPGNGSWLLYSWQGLHAVMEQQWQPYNGTLHRIRPHSRPDCSFFACSTATQAARHSCSSGDGMSPAASVGMAPKRRACHQLWSSLLITCSMSPTVKWKPACWHGISSSPTGLYSNRARTNICQITQRVSELHCEWITRLVSESHCEWITWQVSELHCEWITRIVNELHCE